MSWSRASISSELRISLNAGIAVPDSRLIMCPLCQHRSALPDCPELKAEPIRRHPADLPRDSRHSEYYIIHQQLSAMPAITSQP